MPKYYLDFDDVASSGTADDELTVAALLVADTAGHRIRIRSLAVGPADNTPSDSTLLVALKRVEDISAGSAGTPQTSVAAADIARQSTDDVATIITGGIDYQTLEPSVYDARALWMMGFNARGAVVKEWGDQGPVFEQDQLAGLIVVPRAAAVSRVSGCLEFEVI